MLQPNAILGQHALEEVRPRLLHERRENLVRVGAADEVGERVVIEGEAAPGGERRAHAAFAELRLLACAALLFQHDRQRERPQAAHEHECLRHLDVAVEQAAAAPEAPDDEQCDGEQ